MRPVELELRPSLEAKSYEDLARLLEKPPLTRALWPAPYNKFCPDSAIRFLFECCWTDNEANAITEPIPPEAVLERLAKRWVEQKALGEALIVEKSRRLVVSWTLRGLELWSGGLKKEKQVVTGLTYPKAAEHAWRLAFLYRELRKQRPEMDLAPAIERGGDFAAQSLEKIILPNKTTFNILNQMGGSFQGSGYAVVTMEEASQYKQLAYMYSQAGIVTQGKAGTKGGFVVLVANAWPNLEWKRLKRAEGEEVEA